MTAKYVLDEAGEPVLASDFLQWAIWFERGENRLIERTTVDDVEVSTVFLGIDHAFGDGPPLLFESMVFGGSMDQQTRRYTTRSQALEGHAELVAEVVLLAKGGGR
jgi:hypothetical protein